MVGEAGNDFVPFKEDEFVVVVRFGSDGWEEVCDMGGAGFHASGAIIRFLKFFEG